MQTKPVSSWRPGAFFWLNIFYLLILGALITGRQGSWLWVDRIPDPIGGVIPIGVPWFGALGAIVISLYGVFDHNNEWDAKWNYWHLARPVVGAILGVVAFMIFVGLINSTGATAKVTPLKQDPTAGIAYLVLAFVVGFREDTFRSLIKRAADILLGPGIPGVTAASVSITADQTSFPAMALNQPTTVTITVANTGNADVSTNSATATPAGFAAAPKTGAATTVDTNIAGQTIAPGTFHSGTVTITPTATGTLELNFTISGTFGSRTLTIRGVVT